MGGRIRAAPCWERNASCVIAPAEIAGDQLTAQLAERLRVPLFVVEDPASTPWSCPPRWPTPSRPCPSHRRCAVLFGERSSVREIVGVINTEVPGVAAALITEDDTCSPPVCRRTTDASTGCASPCLAPMAPWAELVAQLAAWSPSWVETSN